jgi:hypothetical protein
MKVICINEPSVRLNAMTGQEYKRVIPLTVGNTYTVINIEKFTCHQYPTYELSEIKPNPTQQFFCSTLFAQFSDLDETELVNEDIFMEKD